LLEPNGITSILFDLDGTLRHNRPSYFQSFFNFAVQAGATDSAENRLRATRWLHYYWAQSEELLADIGEFGQRDELFWINHARRSLGAFGCSPEKAEALAPQVYDLFSKNYSPEDWVPEDVIHTLETLQKAGFCMGVLSNRTHPYREHMGNWGLERFFELALAAGEVNTYKPEPEIFLYAVEKMGKKPGETLYVGDNYYADVIGAQRAGLPVILLDPVGVFPEAECTVIGGINDLIELLEK
jgi:HAD superfamily hydrolase (TIGR01509 family)